MKKRIVAFVLSFCMVFGASNAFAIEMEPESAVDHSPVVYKVFDNEIHITVNEYDVYLSNLHQEKTALKAAGYSDRAIDNARTYDGENRIFEFAQLSADALKSRGYDDKQIDILKSYDGRPLENAPELRSVLPHMNATITPGTCSTDYVAVTLHWEWSSAPLIYNYEDVIALRFKAVNVDGERIEGIRYDAPVTYSYVFYHDYVDDEQLYYEGTPMTSTDVTEHVETSFARPDMSLTGYAKRGVFSCRIKTLDSVNADIAAGSFIFAYVFANATVTGYSISYPWGFSISISGDADEAMYIQAIVDSNGNISVDQFI